MDRNHHNQQNTFGFLPQRKYEFTDEGKINFNGYLN